MQLHHHEIKKMVFASLLSLSVYGLAKQLVKWGSEKCPYDTAKTKFVVFLVIAVISAIVLFVHFKTFGVSAK